MLSEKLYTQVERVVDYLAELELEPEEFLWKYEGFVNTLDTLQRVYLRAKEDEFFYDGCEMNVRPE